MAEPWNMDWGGQPASTSAPWERNWDAPAAPPAQPRSLFKEVPIQGYAGLTVDLPKQVGQAMQWMSEPGKWGYEKGSEIQSWADQREQDNPDLAPQTEGRGLIGRALTAGARALGPSAAVMVPAAAGAVAAPAIGAGALLGAGVGAATGAFGLFGQAQAQETYDKLLKAGVPEDEAKKAGYINLMIEGGGETIGNIAALKLFGVASKAITAGASPVANAIGNATSTAVVAPFLKQLPKTAATEIATEFGQGFGEAWVENRFGGPNPEQNDPLHHGAEGATAALGMTILLAPFGLAGFASRAKRNEKIATALQDPEAPIADRLAASKILYNEINEVNPEAAKAWAQNSSFAIATDKPILLDESTTIPQKPIAERAADEANARIAETLQAPTVDQAIQSALAAPTAINMAEIVKQEVDSALAGREVLEAAEKARDEEIAGLHMELQRLIDTEPTTTLQAAYKPKREAAIRDRLAAMGVEVEERPEAPKPEEPIPDSPFATPISTSFEPPKTVAGRQERTVTTAELQGLVDDPTTPAITRHAAITALQARNTSTTTAGAQEAGSATDTNTKDAVNPAPQLVATSEIQPIAAPPATSSSAIPPAPPVVAAPVVAPAAQPAAQSQPVGPTPQAIQPAAAPVVDPVPAPIEPAKIYGKPVAGLTLKQLQNYAKKGNAKAQAEIDRRADIRAAKPPSAKELARRERLAAKAKESRMVKANDSLLQAIAKLGGLNLTERQDTIGDTQGNLRVGFGQHLFSKTGTGADDMATQLHALGYLTDDEINDVDGGVSALKAKIKDDFGSREPRHFSVAESGRRFEDEAARRQELEREIAEAQAQERVELPPQDTPEVANIAELLAGMTPDEVARLDKLSETMSDAEWESAVVQFAKDRDNADQRQDAENLDRGETGGEESPSQSTATTETKEVAPTSALQTRAGTPTARRPNTLYVAGGDWSGHTRQDTLLGKEHNGDPLAAYKAFRRENPDIAPGLIMATDENGQPWKVIAPNGSSIADYNSPEGRYMLGDVDAFRKDADARIEQGREDGDPDKINAAADERIADLKEKIARTEGYLVDGVKKREADLAKQKSGVTINEHDGRFASWKAYFNNEQRASDAISKNLKDLQDELKSWEAKKVKAVAPIAGDYLPADNRPFTERLAELESRQRRGEVTDFLVDMRAIEDTTGRGAKPQKPDTTVTIDSPTTNAGEAPALELTQQTPHELAAQEAEREAKAKADKAEADRIEAEEKAARERKEIAQRSETAASTFQLGQSAEDNLSGQGDIFSQPANTLSAPDLLRAAAAKMEEQAKPAEAGFDGDAFDKKRADTIKASKDAGNEHLDSVTASVETMRGREIFYAHDTKQRGVIRTVDNNGNVYVYWADEYSAGKELASESVEDNKAWLKSSKDLPYMRVERGGKTYVMGSSLGPSDMKDYVFARPSSPAPNPEERPVPPVADKSPAPPTNSGEDGVAPIQGGGVPGAIEATSEDVAKAESAQVVDALNQVLTAADKRIAAKELGSKKWDDSTAKQFMERYAEWLQRGANNLGTALHKLFEKVYNAARNGMLSIAVAFNFNVADYAAPLPVRANATTVRVAIEKPKANFNGVTASADTHLVADWMVRTRQQDGKPFIIADKNNAMLYAFSAGGNLIAKAPALYGATKGDTLTDAQASKSLEQTTSDDKITEAGIFKAEASTYGGAPSLVLKNYKASTLELHRVYLGTPEENRAGRLASDTADDNRVSYGCINALPEFIDSVIAPHFAEGGMVAVLPETKDAKSAFGIPDDVIETMEVAERSGTDENAAEVSWGADKYAVGRARNAGAMVRRSSRRRDAGESDDPTFSRGTSGTMPAYVPDPENQALLDRVARAVSDHETRTVLEAVDLDHWNIDGEERGADNAGGVQGNARADFATARKIAEYFGRQLHLYRVRSGFAFNGVSFPDPRSSLNGHIFVNIAAENPYLAVTGHELLHTMKIDAPDVYRALRAAMLPLIRNTEQYKKAKGMQDADMATIIEEIMADTLGDRMLERGFWEEIAGRRPTLFEKIAKYVLGFLNRIANRANSMGSDKFVSDMNTARRALAEAFLAYGKQKGPVAELAMGILEAPEIKYHRAWHGSPHDFDEFKLQHIGSGEGAQAYGWGAYFAGRREVAQYYRDSLARGLVVTKGGERYDPTWAPKSSATDIAESYAMGRLRDRFSVQKEISKERFAEVARKEADTTEANLKRSGANDPAYVGGENRIAAQMRVIADQIESGEIVVAKAGKIYQVDLAPKEDQYLDWDKPLSEQSEKVKAAIMSIEALKFGKDKETLRQWHDLTGETGAPFKQSGGDIYRNISEILAKPIDEMADGPNPRGWNVLQHTVNDRASNQEAASKYLLSIGIPGIRYLDGSSRGGRPAYRGDPAYLNAAKSFKDDGQSADQALAGMKLAYKGAANTELQAAVDEAYDIQPKPNYNYVIFDDSLVKVEQKFSRMSTIAASRPVSALVDAVMSSPKSLGPLNAFNTQYHKAVYLADRGKPGFKRVYDKMQEYLTDISAFAVQAEQKAPAIFRELTGIGAKSIGRYFKGAASEKDIAAIGPWLNAGTMYGGPSPMDGKVWTDAQLKGDFSGTQDIAPRIPPLTDAQIPLYRQARAAIDQSIETGAKSIIYRHVKKHGIRFDRDMNMEDVVATVDDQIAAAIEAENDRINALQDQIDDPETEFGDEDVRDAHKRLKREIGKSEDQIAALESVKQSVAGIEKQARGLIEHGYMPLKRFGSRTVTARDENGNVKFFGAYDGTPLVPNSANMEMHKVAAHIRELHPEWTVTTGIKAEKSWQMYNGLSLDALENFLDFLDPETKAELERDAVIQEYLKNATNNRSVMKELIHRKGTPGFSTDVPRILASFVTSHARNASGMYHIGDAKAMVEDIPQEEGDIKDEASDLVKYVTEPGEEAAKLRGFLFFHFLGGSVASAVVNLSQTVMITAPYLTQFAGVGETVSRLLSASKQAVRDPATMPGDLGKAMQKAEQEGVTAPQQIHHLTATAANNPFSSNRQFRTFMTVWGGMFGAAEVFNRRVAFIAAYETGKANNVRDPYEFAKNAVNETQFVYNKGNRPNLGRGAVGSVALTFKQYSIGYLELLKRMPPKQQLMMLGVLMLAAGAEGLPFEEDIADLVDTLGQWLGFSTNTGKWTGKVVEDVFGKDLARPILKGLGGVLPVDLHSRLGMQNLLPGTAFFKPSEIDKTRDVAEAIGPLGGVLKSFSDSLQLLARGKWDAAAVQAAPSAVRNAYNGVHMALTGESQDTKGRLAMRDVTGIEAAGKLIGFNPQRAAREGEIKREEMVSKNLRLVRYDEIASDWADGILKKDPTKQADALETLREWNKDNPEMRINPQDMRRAVFRRVQEARKTSAERFTKSLPKSMRPEAATLLQ
jgi:hypothetical protein